MIISKSLLEESNKETLKHYNFKKRQTRKYLVSEITKILYDIQVEEKIIPFWIDAILDKTFIRSDAEGQYIVYDDPFNYCIYPLRLGIKKIFSRPINQKDLQKQRTA